MKFSEYKSFGFVCSVTETILLLSGWWRTQKISIFYLFWYKVQVAYFWWWLLKKNGIFHCCAIPLHILYLLTSILRDRKVFSVKTLMIFHWQHFTVSLKFLWFGVLFTYIYSYRSMNQCIYNSKLSSLLLWKRWVGVIDNVKKSSHGFSSTCETATQSNLFCSKCTVLFQ